MSEESNPGQSEQNDALTAADDINAAARYNASAKCLPECNAIDGHAKGCARVPPPIPAFWEHGSVA